MAGHAVIIEEDRAVALQAAAEGEVVENVECSVELLRGKGLGPVELGEDFLPPGLSGRQQGWVGDPVDLCKCDVDEADGGVRPALEAIDRAEVGESGSHDDEVL
jgi:hypothetical protein